VNEQDANGPVDRMSVSQNINSMSTCPITRTFNVAFNVIQEHKLQFGLVSWAAVSER